MIKLVLDTVLYSKKHQVEILHDALDRLVSVEAEEVSVSNAIVENIWCFLSTSKDRDKTIELLTNKQ